MASWLSIIPRIAGIVWRSPSTVLRLFSRTPSPEEYEDFAGVNAEIERAKVSLLEIQERVDELSKSLEDCDRKLDRLAEIRENLSMLAHDGRSPPVDPEATRSALEQVDRSTSQVLHARGQTEERLEFLMKKVTAVREEIRELERGAAAVRPYFPPPGDNHPALQLRDPLLTCETVRVQPEEEDKDGPGLIQAPAPTRARPG